MGQKKQKTYINLAGKSSTTITRQKRFTAKKGRRRGKSIQAKARGSARSSR